MLKQKKNLKFTQNNIAIVYDFDKVSSRLTDFLKKDEEKSKGAGAPPVLPPPAGGPPGGKDTKTTAPPPSGRPRVVFWFES